VQDYCKLYPLKFREILRTYNFGGQKIQNKLKNHNLKQAPIAETWEISDHETDVSIISNGYWAEKNLRGVIWVLREKLLGNNIYKKTKNYFPLLIKFLDAKRKLGLQIHPDDDFAQNNNLDKMGKAELYYIIDCEENSYINWGINNGVSRKEMSQAVRENEGTELTRKVSVDPGDVIYVPAGWIHAIGAGVLMIEIQQNADITISQTSVTKSMGSEGYVLYKRENAADMFIENMVIKDVPDSKIKIPKLDSAVGKNRKEYLFASRHFALEKLSIFNRWSTSSDENKFYIYTVIKGSGEIVYKGGRERIQKGETVLVPACLGKFEIIPENEVKIIKSYVPDLKDDIINPLLNGGFDRKQIKNLGGFSYFNDIETIF